MFYTTLCGIVTSMSILNSLVENLTSVNRGFPIGAMKLESLSFLLQSPLFEASWILTSICVLQCFCAFVGYNSLLCTIGFNLKGHLQILNSRFQNMNFEKRQTINFIKYQQDILAICHEFNRLFDIEFFLQVSMSIVFSSVLGFLLITVSCVFSLKKSF